MILKKGFLFLFWMVNWMGIAAAQTQRTIVVDPVDDIASTNGCSLRDAVSVANSGTSEGLGCLSTDEGTGLPLSYILEVPSMTYFLTGASDDTNLEGDIDVAANVTLIGNGPDLSIINGNQLDRVFHLQSGSLTMDGLTVTGGRLNEGQCGGGIFQQAGTLTLRNTVVHDNDSRIPGGALPNPDGGGICNLGGILRLLDGTRVSANVTENRGGGLYSAGDVEIRNALFDGNLANTGAGMHIQAGVLSMDGSTLSNNNAIQGGGIFLTTAPEVFIANSAIVGNVATDGGGLLRLAGGRYAVSIANSTIANNGAPAQRQLSRGGGVFGSGIILSNVTVTQNFAMDAGGVLGVDGAGFAPIQVAGSIIAGNFTPADEPSDCQGTMMSFGFNLIGANDNCSATFPAGSSNVNNDLVGTTAIPFDPQLVPVSDALLFAEPAAGSAAIDAIPGSNCIFISAPNNPLFVDQGPLLLDQRGAVRNGLCDIGAVESSRVFSNGFEEG